VFTLLGDRDLSAAQVAAQIGCDARRLSRLLYALAHVGLLEVSGGRFRNGIEAAEVLVAGKSGFIGGAHELIAKVWTANLNTAESIRTGRPIAEHDFSTARPEDASNVAKRGAANCPSNLRALMIVDQLPFVIAPDQEQSGWRALGIYHRDRGLFFRLALRVASVVSGSAWAPFGVVRPRKTWTGFAETHPTAQLASMWDDICPRLFRFRGKRVRSCRRPAS
jgi:hypothetical protein